MLVEVCQSSSKLGRFGPNSGQSRAKCGQVCYHKPFVRSWYWLSCRKQPRCAPSTPMRPREAPERVGGGSPQPLARQIHMQLREALLPSSAEESESPCRAPASPRPWPLRPARSACSPRSRAPWPACGPWGRRAEPRSRRVGRRGMCAMTAALDRPMTAGPACTRPIASGELSLSVRPATCQSCGTALQKLLQESRADRGWAECGQVRPTSSTFG